jgi:hypothetical protein
LNDLIFPNDDRTTPVINPAGALDKH